MYATTIRWLVKRDLDRVLEIERASFEGPWTRREFMEFLEKRKGICLVVDTGDDVVGYVLYELHKTSLHLESIAVAPEHRRCGVATDMVQQMINKLYDTCRDRITLEVVEQNLGAQLFFKSLGFKATEILTDHYSNSDNNAYRFVFKVIREPEFVAGTRQETVE